MIFALVKVDDIVSTYAFHAGPVLLLLWGEQGAARLPLMLSDGWTGRLRREHSIMVGVRGFEPPVSTSRT